MAVVIERTESEYLIKLPLNIAPADIQNILEYIQFIDIVSRSKATEKDINKLSKRVKSGWAATVKNKLAHLEEFKDLFE